MKHAVISRIKSVLGPIAKQRFRIEQAKYHDSRILSPQVGNDWLASSLAAGQPCAVGKIGAAELGGLLRYENRKDAQGFCSRWGSHAMMLHRNAGVYPADSKIFSRFCGIYAESIAAMDALAVWFRMGERRVQLRYAPQATLLSLTAIEPYYHRHPWSRMLAGKRVLVLTPFADSVQSQSRRIKDVWRSLPEVMPEWMEVETLRIPLSAALIEPVYPDWFVALDEITRQMESRTFDVAIVGAGAWSLPLVARAKRMGKWAIHLGGSTQILFGVKGRRWDDNRLVAAANNEAWVRPNDGERPKSFQAIEQGCYW